MTYARARLWLGVSSVGSIVLAAILGVVFELPTRTLPTDPIPFMQEASLLLLAFGIYALLSLPFDLLGGLLLPRRFGRTKIGALTFLVSWIRGVSIQALWAVALGLVLLQVARATGSLGTIGVAALASWGLIHAQPWLARCVGGLRRLPLHLVPTAQESDGLGLPRDRVDVFDHTDPGFTGGWTGAPGRERLVLPRSWLATLPPDELQASVARRVATLRSGSRSRGLWMAYAWNVIGFALAALSAGPPLGSVAGLVNVALLVTLWSFIGALVLPSLSRPAVFAADRLAREGGIDERVLSSALRRLDSMGDDEPRRTRWIETIFHPIPSPEHRELRLSDRLPTGPTAWHAARMALFLSWGCLGFLGRAVHCNCGRPELWVLLPAD